jgi:hypothetical protein
MATKQRKIEINYRLLQTSCNIEVVGSVPDMQVYQADKAEYTPDYTLTPLVLFPRCNATILINAIFHKLMLDHSQFTAAHCHILRYIIVQ